MKLYFVLGISWLSDERHVHFYGCFLSKEEAEKVKKDLEESPNRNKYETFEIDEHVLGEPTDLYDFTMTP